MSKTPSLRLTLSNIEARYKAGQELRPADERLLAEVYYRNTERQEMTFGSNDEVIITRSHDASDVIQTMKDFAPFVSATHRKTQARRLVGSIDVLLASQWATEWNCAVGTAEFNKLAVARLSNDIDYRKLRAGH